MNDDNKKPATDALMRQQHTRMKSTTINSIKKHKFLRCLTNSSSEPRNNTKHTIKKTTKIEYKVNVSYVTKSVKIARAYAFGTCEFLSCTHFNFYATKKSREYSCFIYSSKP